MIFAALDFIFLKGESNKLFQKVKIDPGFKIAEIGGGTGLLTQILSHKVGLNGSVFVTEMDHQKFKKISNRVKNNNLNNVTTSLVTGEVSYLPDSLFDVIVMKKVYHHFTKAVEQNQIFYEHLKPTGKLVIIDFEPKWYLKTSVPKGIPKSYGGHGINKDVLIKEVTQTGFKLESIEDNFALGGLYCAIFTKTP